MNASSNTALDGPEKAPIQRRFQDCLRRLFPESLCQPVVIPKSALPLIASQPSLDDTVAMSMPLSSASRIEI